MPGASGQLAHCGDPPVLLTPSECRVVEHRPDRYWLYVVTNCATEPTLQEPGPNRADLPWWKVWKKEKGADE